MADLGKAYIEIVPSAKGIKSKIEGELNAGGAGAAGESTGKRIGGSLLSGLKGVFAAAAIGKVLKDALEAGGNLQQSFGGLETIYGDAADAAKTYAQEAADAGISANSYAEQAVSFGAALKAAYGGDTMAAMEAANTAILDMADNSAKMGTPLESVQAAYQGFAKGQYQLLDNLKLGYGGTKTEMERLLSDAEKLTGVKYDINNLGDVYNAIHAIQGDLGLTGVAAKEAETTLTGSFGAVKASWENVMAAMTTGEGLDTAMQNLTTSVSNFATNVLSMLGNLAPQIPTLILGLAQAAVSAAPEFASAAFQMIGQLALGLANALPGLISQIPEFAGQIITAFFSVDWGAIGSAIINGIIQGLLGAAGKLWEAIKNLARGALDQLKSELGIGSPSRVFAAEVGRWIPPGVGMGIEDALPSMSYSVDMLAETSVDGFRRATAPGATAAAAQAQDFDRLAASIAERPVIADVVLEGDARGIFRAVHKTNAVRTRATQYNALGAMT